MPYFLRGVCAIALLFQAAHLFAGEASSEEAIRAAVARSLPLLEASSRRSMEKRPGCFTCHNQCLPIMAVTAARQRGIAVDERNLEAQLDFTAAFLSRNRENYRAGKGQGGAVLTAGYAMLALELGGRKQDETSGAVVEYLLRYQSDRDHWKPQTKRPPTEESSFTTTYLALRALEAFGSEAQRQRIADRRVRVSGWLAATPAASTEDRVFRLLAMKLADVDAGKRLGALNELLRAQRDDGGWSQLEEMEPDAYATATALVALHQAGGVSTGDPAWQRGLGWLLRAQLPNGSWRVKTRSEPIQTYYESGYPHGADQFISISAAGWATTALVLALPDPARR